MEAPEFPETQEYWTAAAEGRLLVRHCRSCGENHHYPRVYCPFCMSGNTDWLEASGIGILYSYTIWRRREAFTIPAFVTLPEGPTILTELVGVAPDGLMLGQAVALAPVSPDRRAPAFTAPGASVHSRR